MRERVVLSCSTCNRRNYTADKNKALHPDRVEIRKFCPTCRTHTVHRETR